MNIIGDIWNHLHKRHKFEHQNEAHLLRLNGKPEFIFFSCISIYFSLSEYRIFSN